MRKRTPKPERAPAVTVQRACSAARSDWTQTPPDRNGQGYWWWWNGDDDCAPEIITVMYSGTDDKCFVCVRDDQEARNVDNERWSGWWKRIQDEMPPNAPDQRPRQ